VITAAEGEIALRRLYMKAPPPPRPGSPPEIAYLRAERVRLVDSIARLIFSRERPQLVRTWCERSFGLDPPGATWGVCAGDLE